MLQSLAIVALAIVSVLTSVNVIRLADRVRVLEDKMVFWHGSAS